MEHNRVKIEQALADLKREVDDSIIRKLEQNMYSRLKNLRGKFGNNMQAYSHGEAFLKILETRMRNMGIFILDEP